jgi:hypothetical protein
MMALFLFILILYTELHTFISSHSSIVIRRGSSSGRLSGEEPPWGAAARIELEPALQQADALSTELRRTL